MAEVIKIQSKQRLIKRINSFFISYFKLIVTGLLLLILLVGYFFILLPEYNRISNQLNSAETTQILKQKNYQQYLGQLEQLNNVYDNIKPEDFTKINDLLPDTPESEQLMVEIQKIVNDNGYILTSLTVEPDDNSISVATDAKQLADSDISKKSLGQVKISLGLTGVNYEGLKNLLTVFEKNLRLLDVTQLSWSPGNGLVSLTFTAYYLK